MPQFRKQMEAKTILHTASASAPLRCVTLGDKCLYQMADLAFLVEPARSSQLFYDNVSENDEPHLSVFPSVNHTCNVRDGDTRLRDVSGYIVHQPLSGVDRKLTDR